LSEKEVLTELVKSGYKALRIQALGEAKHIFTHKEWHMIGYAIRVDELERPSDTGSYVFAEREETEQRYPIPSAFSPYAKYIKVRVGNEKYKL